MSNTSKYIIGFGGLAVILFILPKFSILIFLIFLLAFVIFIVPQIKKIFTKKARIRQLSNKTYVAEVKFPFWFWKQISYLGWLDSIGYQNNTTTCLEVAELRLQNLGIMNWDYYPDKDNKFIIRSPKAIEIKPEVIEVRKSPTELGIYNRAE